MRLVAILELPAVSEPDVPAALVRAAYQASRRGPVALLIPGSAKPALDRQLDPLVAENRFVHGVRYTPLADRAVWQAASRDTVVVAFSREARDRAAEIGATCVDTATAVAALDAISRAADDARPSAASVAAWKSSPSLRRTVAIPHLQTA